MNHRARHPRIGVLAELLRAFGGIPCRRARLPSLAVGAGAPEIANDDARVIAGGRSVGGGIGGEEDVLGLDVEMVNGVPLLGWAGGFGVNECILDAFVEVCEAVGHTLQDVPEEGLRDAIAPVLVLSRNVIGDVAFVAVLEEHSDVRTLRAPQGVFQAVEVRVVGRGDASEHADLEFRARHRACVLHLDALLDKHLARSVLHDLDRVAHPAVLEVVDELVPWVDLCWIEAGDFGLLGSDVAVTAIVGEWLHAS
ncbi:hypothetical protein BDY17DRAFT_305947 [Neohortaea acidophila]|uniref:Uncharacterized protein n=1 Tax=Neohortaea acidophila TaxID=245834 RepID=A0A6A6PGE6_9PEZI|nr:uncharacterized protein BDY17DRAFT_305947 [Neohortaea acidophila]KAF2478856.1 hypothetical protein BDY17DRAFT_305947 [Neohortaea acidophila]